MKAKLFISLLLSVIVIGSCSSIKTQNNMSIDYAISPFINDSIINPHTNDINLFESYEELASYATRSENNVVLLKPENITKRMGNEFESFKNDDNKEIYHEMYYIYDETIGNCADETKDVPYYSLKIKSYFYSFDKKADFHYTIGTNKDFKDVIFVNVMSNDDSCFGTIYFEQTGIDVDFQWVDNYCQRNLKEIGNKKS